MSEITASAQGLRRAFWGSDDTFASSLLLLLVDCYGTEALSWHPGAVREMIEDDYLGGAPGQWSGERRPLPDGRYGKLMAAVALVTTDLFYRSAHGFRCLSVALCGGGLDTGTVDFPDAAEAAWAMTEGMLIDPPEGDEPFAPDVEALVAELVKNDGLLDPPDVLRLGHDGGPDLSQWSDRPDVVAAVRSGAAARSAAVKAGLEAEAGRLADQLAALPLLSGDARKAAEGLRGALKRGKPRTENKDDGAIWDMASIFKGGKKDKPTRKAGR